MHISDPHIFVNGHRFRRYLSTDDLRQAVCRLAGQISSDYASKTPLLCPVLTGSFVFAADLSRALSVEHEISFVRYNSYEGMQSSGSVVEKLPFDPECSGRHIIIVEDIVESGLSISAMLPRLADLHPASVAICSLFYKPNKFKGTFKLDYVGFSIPDEFIIGYGLDYDGIARSYDEVFVLDAQEET